MCLHVHVVYSRRGPDWSSTNGDKKAKREILREWYVLFSHLCISQPSEAARSARRVTLIDKRAVGKAQKRMHDDVQESPVSSRPFVLNYSPYSGCVCTLFLGIYYLEEEKDPGWRWPLMQAGQEGSKDLCISWQRYNFRKFTVDSFFLFRLQ